MVAHSPSLHLLRAGEEKTHRAQRDDRCARRVRIEIPVPRGQGTFVAEIETDKKYMNTWVQVELPLDRFDVASDRRMTLSTDDRLESIHLWVAAAHVFGDDKPFLAIDDLRIVLP